MTTTAVMVTFNRLQLLKETLNAYLNMQKGFDDIIIIDNNSTDGTFDFLEKFKEQHKFVQVVHLDRNIGGSGGFSYGVEVALKNTQSDWLFLADDDAVPDVDMLGTLEEYYSSVSNKNEIAALCTSVINNGSYDLDHRRILEKKFFKVSDVSKVDLYKNNFITDEISFVGLLVKREVVNKIGLPDKDFFIYYDDTDYSYKIKKCGLIICVPASKMYHNTSLRQSTKIDWRSYYSIRNYIVLLKRYYKPRYYRYRAFAVYIKNIFNRQRSKEEKLLIKTAISDGKKEKLGINDKYSPTGFNKEQK